MLGKWLGKNRTTTGPATTDRSAPVSVPVDAAAGAGAGSVWTPERALRALEEQRALCEKLDQLSLAQRTLIEGGRADALVELLKGLGAGLGPRCEAALPYVPHPRS